MQNNENISDQDSRACQPLTILSSQVQVPKKRHPEMTAYKNGPTCPTMLIHSNKFLRMPHPVRMFLNFGS